MQLLLTAGEAVIARYTGGQRRRREGKKPGGQFFPEKGV